MSLRSIGAGSFARDGTTEVELQAIRKERDNDDADKNTQPQEPKVEVVYDMEVAKQVAHIQRDASVLASTYSWLPQQEQPVDEGTVKPVEIAGPPKELLYKHTPKGGFLLTSLDSFVVDWIYTVVIGVLVVSYWRVRRKSVYVEKWKLFRH
jgi:hypothetical protein